MVAVWSTHDVLQKKTQNPKTSKIKKGHRERGAEHSTKQRSEQKTHHKPSTSEQKRGDKKREAREKEKRAQENKCQTNIPHHLPTLQNLTQHININTKTKNNKKKMQQKKLTA